MDVSITVRDDGKLQTRALEYNIVEHCNLSCMNCDHASPLFSKRFIDLDLYTVDLTVLAKYLHTEEFKIIGGEPLLHPRILDAIQIVRDSGISNYITVATNGLLIDRMDDVFWRGINRLWLSIYPGVRLRIAIDNIQEKADAFGVQLDIFNMDRFRHTMLNTRIANLELVARIFEKCQMPVINYCHTLRNGHYFKCSPAPFTQDRLNLSGVDYSEFAQDGVCIHSNPNLVADLIEYLTAKHPLAACSYCLGTSGKWFPHCQMNKEEIARTFSEPDDYLDLIDRSLISTDEI